MNLNCLHATERWVGLIIVCVVMREVNGTHYTLPWSGLVTQFIL